MNFSFDGTDYKYPNTLADITLGQRIAFQEQYGNALDSRAKEIAAMEPGFEADIEHSLWQLTSAVQSFSFFTGIALEKAQKHIAMDQVVKVYNASLAMLFEQERDITLLPYYEWMGERWTIAAPEVTPNSKFVFDEFLTAKEAVRQLVALGKGKWEALPYLCCIYFRKQGEPYSEVLIDPEGERMSMMHQLPLDHALHVGFFLANTLTIYTRTSAFSSLAREGKVLT